MCTYEDKKSHQIELRTLRGLVGPGHYKTILTVLKRRALSKQGKGKTDISGLKYMEFFLY